MTLPAPPRVIVLAAVLLLALGGGFAQAVITRQGNLQVTLTGKISPHALPRAQAAPIAVSIGGQVATVDGSLPPRLKKLTIDINRNGRLESRGLPVCSIHQIQPGTSGHALSACRSALVGQGSFSAYIVLKGEEPYVAPGRLLVFNGREGRRQVLLGHIFLSRPFASSFVIVFAVAAQHHGPYGTTLTANLAQALGTRRYLTGIQMRLSRRYVSGGARRSFLSAACPALKGFPGAVFPLARASFAFVGHQTLTSTLTGTCGVRG